MSAELKRTDTATDTLAQKTKDGSVVSGGHLVAKALKQEGVDTIFTLCGGHIIDIYDGCLDEGIRIIDVRHEQTAAHAADGYARQTGRLGCVVSIRKPYLAYRWAEFSNATQDGLAAGSTPRRYDDSYHQVCVRCVFD